MRWKSFKTVDEVRNALEAVLPVNTPVTAIRDTLRTLNLECSELVEDVIYCSAPATPRGLFISRKWLMEFHFSKDSLTSIIVKEGLTGP